MRNQTGERGVGALRPGIDAPPLRWDMNRTFTRDSYERKYLVTHGVKPAARHTRLVFGVMGPAAIAGSVPRLTAAERFPAWRLT